MSETPLVLRMPWKETDISGVEPLLTREWIVTNGLGGYASGTVAGVATRRYHGLLIAALETPSGRMMMFNHLREQLRLPDGTTVLLGGHEHADRLDLEHAGALTEFRLEDGLPVWRFEISGFVLEKRLVMPHRQNTSHLFYTLIEGDGPVRLSLRPSLNVRPHDASVNAPLENPYAVTVIDDRYEFSASPNLPPLRIKLQGEHPELVLAGARIKNLFYRIEAARGYPDVGDLWSPGRFRVALNRDRPATLTASVEPWETIEALPPADALQAEHERRRRLIQAADPHAHERPPGRAGAGGRPVPDPPDRPHERCRARPRHGG